MPHMLPMRKKTTESLVRPPLFSSIVYTPEESIDVMKYLYQKKDKTWGDYGFYDAFSETENWYPQQYLAIDQGPIAIMIENYRSQLLWNLFMQHPDIQKRIAANL